MSAESLFHFVAPSQDVEESPETAGDSPWRRMDLAEQATYNYLDKQNQFMVTNDDLRASVRVALDNTEQNLEYNKVTIDFPKTAQNPELDEVCHFIEYATQLRDKYLFVPDNQFKSFNLTPEYNPLEYGEIPEAATDHVFYECDGVWQVYNNEQDHENNKPIVNIIDFAEFAKDLYKLLRIVSYGPCKTYCFNRLQLLDSKYNLHVALNETLEVNVQKTVPHRDFYNVRKVDGHVHHSSSMNQKHLLKFIKLKLRHAADEVVIYRDDKTLTLKEVFESLNFTADNLSVDTLDVHAHNDTFHRFDKFNLKYNPCGQSRLREIFLKTDNLIKGRYLAEITQELHAELESTKYQCAEWRLSIYGRSPQEWDKLAHWVVDNQLFSDNTRWMIQIPRLYSVYRENDTDKLTSFSLLLKNIFEPLFAVTRDPSSNPTLHKFLYTIVGFDTVDDESKPERLISKGIPSPNQWTGYKNPPYDYYMYYLYANITSLNAFRQQKNLNLFSLRPHSGEAGDFNHLASAFLLATSINHGINLRKTPVLQYLFYLKQIGLAMSPLSNNALFLNYSRNPFPVFFGRGLNVALSSDDPLQFHYSREPLIEEYSVAKAVWKLSSCDLSEIARNSVLQSGFSHAIKSYWLGSCYWQEGVEGNDIRKTNIPDIRMAFRQANLDEEWRNIKTNAANCQDISSNSWKKLSRW